MMKRKCSPHAARSFSRIGVFLVLITSLPVLGTLFWETPFEYSRITNPSAILIHSREGLPDLPFSLPITLLMLILGLTPLIFTAVVMLKSYSRTPLQKAAKQLPWWGVGSLAALLFFWAMAWGAIPQSSMMKQLNFTLLWVSAILFFNALSYRKKGRCLFVNHTRYFFLLFIVSIPFWWYFEYLNRFVLNWYYLGDESYSEVEYLFFGTFAFSTVLPAVMSLQELFLCYTRVFQGFDEMPKLSVRNPYLAAGIGLMIGCATLLGIAIFPESLYLFLWVSPLLILVSLQTFWGEWHIFRPLAEGKAAPFVTAALAALAAGFFWEVWNLNSLPKWVYVVPWIPQIKIFEMPVIGYLGYLPFGLECYAVAMLVKKGGGSDS